MLQIFLERNHKRAVKLEPGKFYTNALNKGYRCIEVNGDQAVVRLFDEVDGKPLEVKFRISRNAWKQFYELPRSAETEELKRRYQRTH